MTSNEVHNCPSYEGPDYDGNPMWFDCEDNRPHLEPIVEWIGNMPLSHGERSDWVHVMFENPPCLCGHPDYLSCPGTLAGHDISGVTIERRPE